jgi:hypothetical protein
MDCSICILLVQSEIWYTITKRHIKSENMVDHTSSSYVQKQFIVKIINIEMMKIS